jgi:glycosyltransferase involved in cell wall biosynthesis
MVYSLESYFSYWFKKYSGNVNIFISPSLFLKQKLVAFGWAEDRILHLPNFIRVEDFDPQFDPGDYFLYLGRLSSEKGILTLINAFMKLDKPEARLVVVGDGPVRKDLEKQASQDPRISFSGYLSGETLSQATKNGLAVVIPSEWYENAPISILESFAHAKPVIGSRIGGIPEMIDDGVNGYLFEPGNVEALKEKLECVLNLPTRKIMEMGKSAREKVEIEYNADLHYERLMAIYLKTLGKTQ